MHIAIDIDDTITHAPVFFRLLTHALTDTQVSIVSYRDDEPEAMELLNQLGIRYDRLILSNDAKLGVVPGQPLHEWKARVVGVIGADVFFDDMPEIVHRVEPPTKVFMCCDDVMRGWLREQLDARP